MSSQRGADGVPETATRGSTKRARGDKDVENFIIVSPGTIQRTGEESVSGAPSKGDGVVFQSSHQMSSEDTDDAEMACGALLELRETSTDFAGSGRVQNTKSSQDDIPNSTIEPDYPSLYSPSPNRDSQNSGEASNSGIPANFKQDRQNSATLPATLDEQSTSQLSNSQRSGSGTSSIVQSGQPTSFDNLSPHPDGLPRHKIFGDDESTTMPGSPDAGPFWPVTQDTGNSASPRASLHRPKQTSTRNVGDGSQPSPPRRISSPDATAGNNPPSRPNANARARHTLLPDATVPEADFVNGCRAGGGHSSADLNQPRSSSNVTITGNAVPQGIGPGRQLGPDKRSHASSQALSSQPVVSRPPPGAQAPYFHHPHPHPPLASSARQHGFSRTPQTNYQPQTDYRPPPVEFTIDNCVISNLPPNDTQPLFEVFLRYAQLLLLPDKTPTRDTIYQVNYLMWQKSLDFYKWYTAVSGTADVQVLRFELVDVRWQPETVFLVPRGNLNHFRALKQYIWNFFWVASQVNGAPAIFKILISASRTTSDQQNLRNSAVKLVGYSAPRVNDSV
jgi:hypothetical protein